MLIKYILFFLIFLLLSFVILKDSMSIESIIFLTIYSTLLIIIFTLLDKHESFTDTDTDIDTNIDTNIDTYSYIDNNISINKDKPKSKELINKYVIYEDLIENSNQLYKIFKGFYSKGVLSSGYGFLGDTSKPINMKGGSSLENIKKKGKDLLNKINIRENKYRPINPKLELEKKYKIENNLLIDNKNKRIITDDYKYKPKNIYTRNAALLYSGDIINIYFSNLILQRNNNDNVLTFSKPLKEYGTNISKLRFELKKSNIYKNMVINYGDIVYIKHNIYRQNKNISQFIKHGNDLQSHYDDAEYYAEFQLFDAENIYNVGPVNFNNILLIAKYDTIQNKYLKFDSNKNNITLNASIENATPLRIELIRPFELINTHLSIINDDNEFLFN